MHVIDGDAAWAQIARHAFGQTDQRGFAHGINCAAGKGHAFSVGAANIDDSATVIHMARRFLAGDKYAAHVDSQRAIQIFQRQLFGTAHRKHAGVVHQNVQITQAVYCLAYRLLQGRGIGTVGLDGERFTAGGGDFGHQGVCFFGGGDVGEGYGGAFTCQALNNGGTNAA
ncbi:hypothetical protein D3C71_1587980 [compost metagenome]